MTTSTRMASVNYVAYYRVSTRHQGESGLGLADQRAAVAGFARGPIVAEFTEVETKKNNQRVQSGQAIERARQEGAILVIAKLDHIGGPALKSQCLLHFHPARFGRELSMRRYARCQHAYHRYIF